MLKAYPFMSAEWRYLTMLNYVVEPAVLRPLVPAGTELDDFHGVTFVSMVGFEFQGMRVAGIPLLTDFEEVNLRFYVRRRVDGEWRRGVVFVREIVPHGPVALAARVFYGEPYIALPMRHEIEHTETSLNVRYEWKHEGRWNSLSARSEGAPGPIEPGSAQEFITEHYWGYSAHRVLAREYEVEHPQWRVWAASEADLDCDVASLYGDAFAEPLREPPASALIAEGSPVLVRCHAPVREESVVPLPAAGAAAC